MAAQAEWLQVVEDTAFGGLENQPGQSRIVAQSSVIEWSSQWI